MEYETLDGGLTQYLHGHNLEIYAEQDFILYYDDANRAIMISHKREPYFRMISCDNTILDCVITVRIELNDTKNKIIAEVGIEESTAGFYMKLYDSSRRYSMFLDKYTEKEKDDFESFILDSF